ncbi:MAG: Wzz/FepE/Etk N-terminal domain-containing protein [Candidatus Zixiibacteriota bacterium]
MKNRITITRSNSGEDNYQLNDPITTLELTLVDSLRVILKHKRMIIITVVAVMVLTAAVSMLLPNTYLSTATVLPSGQVDKMSELKNLAGLSGLVTSDENSSALFPVILRSRLVKEALLKRKYIADLKTEKMIITLPEYFKEDNKDVLYAALDKISSISVSNKDGVINLGVETRYADLSRAVLTAYLEELENFNIHKRRSQAKENVAYLTTQLAERKRELEEAQTQLEEFQKQNRDWAGSTDPEIIKALSQYQMDIEVKAKSYLYLSQEYEMARREVQNDIPIVSILDAPSRPEKKAGPRRSLLVMAAGMLAFSFTVFGLLVREIIRKREEGPDRELYQALKKEVISGVPGISRLLDKKPKSASLERTTFM